MTGVGILSYICHFHICNFASMYFPSNRSAVSYGCRGLPYVKKLEFFFNLFSNLEICTFLNGVYFSLLNKKHTPTGRMSPFASLKCSSLCLFQIYEFQIKTIPS